MISKEQITDLYKIFITTPSVCTDTRKLKKDDLFFALKGDNFNGNKYAKQALESGASRAVIDEKSYEIPGKTFLVEDVLEALQALASHHRDQFNIPFIGITGSNGKTTTKELVYSVLSTTFNTHCTAGNFNNHIGVPLTLLSMSRKTEIAIIEMGANKPGDIQELCDIAKPTHGVITNIGKAHLEGFGGLEGVARTKSALFRHLLENKGTAIVNLEHEMVARMGARFANPLGYSYTDKSAYCYGELIEVNPFIKLSYGKQKNVQTQLMGKYNFENILAALAFGKLFNVNEAKAVGAIKNYRSNNNRSQLVKTENNTILLDAYNANPSSMYAAISSFKEVKHENKVVVLGDMFELGAEAVSEHVNLFKEVSKLNFKEALFVGELFKEALPNDANVFKTKKELINEINSKNYNQTLVLLKGSRGMGLEELTEIL